MYISERKTFYSSGNVTCTTLPGNKLIILEKGVESKLIETDKNK